MVMIVIDSVRMVMVMMVMRMRTKLSMLNDGVLGQLILYHEVHHDDDHDILEGHDNDDGELVMTELWNLVKTPTNSLLITRPFSLRRRRTLKV